MQTNYCPYCLRLVSSNICPHCGNNIDYQDNPVHLPVGYTLNGKHPYILGAALGQGGFGITYIALDIVTNCRVAVKEFFPSHYAVRSDDATVQFKSKQGDACHRERDRFATEAQVLFAFADLPCIVTALDYFEANNTVYLVMEYLDGCTLKDYVVQNGKVPAQQFLRALSPLMQDLENMHSRGVIHSNISPDNIILLSDGTMKLIDLSCAHLNNNEKYILVTQHYTPIEQHKGQELDPRADVYALAATIYYCVTGIRPEESIARLTQNAPLQSAVSLGACLSNEQEQALENALALQPENRTQSVAALLGQLQLPYTAVVQDAHGGFVAQIADNQGATDLASKLGEVEQNQTEKQEGQSQKSKKAVQSNKTVAVLAAVAVAVIVFCSFLVTPKVKNASDYKAAEKLYMAGDYLAAAEAFQSLNTYNDSQNRVWDAYYQNACQLFEAAQYEEAIIAFTSLGNYLDSTEKIKEAKYLYVLAHRTLSDASTVQYLNELMELEYKDSKDIYNSMLPYHITVLAINTDRDKQEQLSDTLSKSSDEYHFRFQVQADESVDGAQIKVYIRHKDGTEYIIHEENEVESGVTYDIVTDYIDVDFGETCSFCITITNENTNVLLGEICHNILITS